MSRLVCRAAEVRAVSDFLPSATREPSALLIEGEPGIGKTTLWLDAVERAPHQGFVVLTARGAAAESIAAYAALADMLDQCEASLLELAGCTIASDPPGGAAQRADRDVARQLRRAARLADEAMATTALR
jgi:predicted ATP-dependent serine protease